jgi:hypothetical protein
MSVDRTFTCHGSGFLPVSLLALLAFGVGQLQAQTPIYSLPFGRRFEGSAGRC